MNKNFNYFSILTKLNYIFLKYNSYLHFSFTDLQNKHFQVKTNKFLTIFHVIFIIVSSSITFAFFNSLINSNTFFVAKIITLFNCYFVCSICVGVILWSHVIKKKMFLVFQTTCKLNEYFKTKQSQVNNKNKNACSTSNLPKLAAGLLSVELLLFLVTAIWLISARSFVSLDISFFSSLILVSFFTLVYMSQSVSIAMFVIMHLNASEIFATVNGKMADLTAGGGETKLRLCARFHVEACELTKIASGVTAFPCLILFATGFVQTTMQIYTHIIWEEDMAGSWWLFAYQIGCISYRFVAIIVVAEKANCGWIGTKNVLQELMLKNKQEKGILKEIRIFFIQLLHYEARISAGGIFDINYPLGFTIVTGVVTYLTILIQTDPYASQRVAKYIFNTE